MTVQVGELEGWFTLIYIISRTGYITEFGTRGCRRRGKIGENSKFFWA